MQTRPMCLAPTSNHAFSLSLFFSSAAFQLQVQASHDQPLFLPHILTLAMKLSRFLFITGIYSCTCATVSHFSDLRVGALSHVLIAFNGLFKRFSCCPHATSKHTVNTAVCQIVRKYILLYISRIRVHDRVPCSS